MEQVAQGGYVYIGDLTIMELAVSENCELAIMYYKFFPMRYVVGLQNNSAYQADVSNV